MAAEIPTSEPLEIVAGDTVKWTKSLPDYSATEWTLRYRIIGAGVDHEATVTVVGSGWSVEFAASLMTAIVADLTCRLVGWVEAASEKWTIYDDYVRVLPNLRTATAANLKTTEVATLEVIEAAISGRLTADMESYQIDGKSVTKIPVLQLMQLRGTYRALVWRQQNPGKSFPSVKTRFVSPSAG